MFKVLLLKVAMSWDVACFHNDCTIIEIHVIKQFVDVVAAWRCLVLCGVILCQTAAPLRVLCVPQRCVCSGPRPNVICAALMTAVCIEVLR